MIVQSECNYACDKETWIINYFIKVIWTPITSRTKLHNHQGTAKRNYNYLAEGIQEYERRTEHLYEFSIASEFVVLVYYTDRQVEAISN